MKSRLGRIACQSSCSAISQLPIRDRLFKHQNRLQDYLKILNWTQLLNISSKRSARESPTFSAQDQRLRGSQNVWDLSTNRFSEWMLSRGTGQYSNGILTRRPWWH